MKLSGRPQYFPRCGKDVLSRFRSGSSVAHARPQDKVCRDTIVSLGPQFEHSCCPVGPCSPTGWGPVHPNSRSRRATLPGLSPASSAPPIVSSRSLDACFLNLSPSFCLRICPLSWPLYRCHIFCPVPGTLSSELSLGSQFQPWKVDVTQLAQKF